MSLTLCSTTDRRSSTWSAENTLNVVYSFICYRFSCTISMVASVPKINARACVSIEKYRLSLIRFRCYELYNNAVLRSIHSAFEKMLSRNLNYTIPAIILCFYRGAGCVRVIDIEQIKCKQNRLLQYVCISFRIALETRVN